MHELCDIQDPPQSELLEHLTPVDLAQIEGYKIVEYAKVEAALSPAKQPQRERNDKHVPAVASGYARPSLALPTLDINYIPAKTGLLS